MPVRKPEYDSQCFDFEIGHLKKSPCKGCFQQFQFPGCMDPCALLNRIQTRLARTVLTSRNHSPVEPFAIHLDQQTKK